MTKKNRRPPHQEMTATQKEHNNNTINSDRCQGDNSAASQRGRILRWLKSRSLTTLQARHDLDVMHPGMRVCELRKAGHRIETVWTFDFTPEGYQHRVGKYILRPGRQMTLFDLLGIGGSHGD